MTVAQQHRIDKLTFGLLLGASIVGTYCNYLVNQGFWNPRLSHTGLILLLLFQPFYLGWIYSIGNGRRWAKILYLALAGLGLASTAFGYKQIASDYFTSPLATVNYISQQGLAFIAGVLMAWTLLKPTPEKAMNEEEAY